MPVYMPCTKCSDSPCEAQSDGHPMMSGETAGRWQCCATRKSRYHRPLWAKASDSRRHRRHRRMLQHWRQQALQIHAQRLKKAIEHLFTHLVYMFLMQFIHVSPNLLEFWTSTTISELANAGIQNNSKLQTWRFLALVFLLRKQLANFWSTSPDDQQLGVHKSAAVLKPSTTGPVDHLKKRTKLLQFLQYPSEPMRHHQFICKKLTEIRK